MEVPHPDDCAICGREIPSWAFASVTTDDEVVNLCHREHEYPTCYERWTVYDVRPKHWMLEMEDVAFD